MPDFYLKFMTPDVWDALLLGVILIGLALAALRLMKDRSVYDLQRRRTQSAEESRRTKRS